VHPWYRHRWPWLLIAGPALVVIAGFVTAYLAWSTDDGVIAEDYYKRGLLINRSLEREARARALNLGATVELDATGNVRVALRGADAAMTSPSVTLRLVHATRAGLDRSAALSASADRLYRGRIDPPPAGRWIVSVEADGWRLPPVEIAGRVSAVELDASPR
jgi:hypothetical protein